MIKKKEKSWFYFKQLSEKKNKPIDNFFYEREKRKKEKKNKTVRALRVSRKCCTELQRLASQWLATGLLP